MSQVVPLTGAISLTLIDGLTGDGPGSVTVVPPPLRLSIFGGQDITIPVAPNPIKYSDFRGAMNYGNFTISLTNLSYNSITSTARAIYYKKDNHNYANHYPVLYLGDVTPNAVFKTKTCTLTGTTSIVEQNATIDVSMYGFLDDGVTLLMQINDEQYNVVTTLSSTSTTTLSSNSLSDVLTQLRLDNTIAPQLIRSTTGLVSPDPFLQSTPTVAFVNQSNALLSQLTNYANSLSPVTQYSANLVLNSPTQTSIVVTTNTYNYISYPLCYPICSASHPARKQGWSGVNRSFTLSHYPVSQGDNLKFYIGPGPGTATNGHIWSRFSLTIAVTNPPRLIFT